MHLLGKRCDYDLSFSPFGPAKIFTEVQLLKRRIPSATITKIL